MIPDEETRLAEMRAERERANKVHEQHNRKSHAVGLQDLRRRKQRRRTAERGRQMLREIQQRQ